MRVIQACLVGISADPAAQGVASLLHDLLWAHALPSDGLEHVRARTGEHGLDVVLFVRAPSDASALARMRALLDRTEGPVASHGFALALR
ncbi:hypothetical protein ACGFNX_19475 [Streptomyces sp. NPDC048723]|uniref:hypothetical protein n=1 Tax=Streptomyces sp. NPDC048723 TaxID=3365589 RepID=UPI003720FCAD